MKFARFVVVFQVLGSIQSAVAQVVPDRMTTTTVTNTSNRMTVGIAAANKSGISHNTYTEFSVPKAGVNLNNRGIDATTIVNEVTSTRRSLLNGPLEVLGSRAHVVVANPNGMTIDGAQFINTGGVALSGGKVRFDNAGATGSVNSVLSTGEGDVTVSGAGLSGSMTTLQLIAGRIKIDGAVVNTHISPSADVGLVAGRSEVTLDSTVSPLVTLRPLTSRRDLDASRKELLVDITPRGSLTASRIAIAVNSRGAGVSYAGHGQATIGDFHIDANGKVTTKGATIKAEKGVKIIGRGIDVLNSTRRQSNVSSITKGVTLLATRADIKLHGALTGSERTEDDEVSKGGVTLKAAGSIRLLSANAKRLAIAFSSKDDLYVESGKGIINDTGQLLSNATTIIRTSGTLANVTDLPTSTSGTTIVRRNNGGLLGSLFGLKRTVAITNLKFGQTRIPGQLGFIAGEAIDIEAGRVENSGEIDALKGALLIRAQTVVNSGFYSGGSSFSQNCGIICWSKGTSDIGVLGGKINATGSAEIVASSNGGERRRHRGVRKPVS